MVKSSLRKEMFSVSKMLKACHWYRPVKIKHIKLHYAAVYASAPRASCPVKMLIFLILKCIFAMRAKLIILVFWLRAAHSSRILITFQ